MKKLKTILLFNASKYAHVAFVLSLFLLATKQYYLIILGLIYLGYLYKKSKGLCVLALIIILIVGVRYFQVNQIKPQNLPMQAEVIEVNKDFIIVKSSHKYIIYAEKTLSYKPGMIIYIEGSYLEFDPLHVEHNFNYLEYLKSQKILGRIAPSQIKVLYDKVNIHSLAFIVKNHFDSHYPNQVSTYMNLLILGQKDGLDEDLIKGTNHLGISHLFAISGMHLGLMVYFFNKFLQLFYLKKQTYHFILTIFLLFYNIMTGFSTSIVRASLFLLILLLTRESKRRFSASDYLSFIFISFIIYNPFYIFSLGFRLSFLMAFTLIIFKSLYSSKKGIKKIFYISLIAIVFSLPISLSINKSFGLLNVLINPLFVVYVSFILLPGAIILILLPVLSQVYLYFIGSFEKLIEYAMNMNLFINFNFSSSLSKLLFWILLVFTCTFYHQHKIKITGLWLLFMIWISITITTNFETKVVIFDVNQADASYIQTKDCKMLIDTGKEDDYDTLIHYLMGENIPTLDAIILSHQHQDHYGEVFDIMAKINVKSVYVSKIYEDINPSIQKVLSKGDTIFCGQTPIHVLNGDQGYTNENNNSLVLLMDIGGESWLFTGDIEEEIEDQLIRDYHFKVDHLKVAHHGSKTSSIETFINHFQPSHAYISVGKNSYGLPDKSVISNLSQIVDKLYITKEQGSIIQVYHPLYHYRYFYYNGRKAYEIDLNI